MSIPANPSLWDMRIIKTALEVLKNKKMWMASLYTATHHLVLKRAAT